MRHRSDILLNSNGDIYINPLTNDLDFGASDIQHLNDITVSFKGWIKRFPALGVGAMAYLKSKGSEQKLSQEISLNCKADGYSVSNTQNFKNFSILEILQSAKLL